MRQVPAAAVALLLALSCIVGPTAAAPVATPSDGEDARDAIGAAAPPASADERAAVGAQDGSFDGAVAECAEEPPDDYADPDEDVIGWSEGYWYDEPLEIDQSDGLSDRELEDLIARTQARVEAIRCLNFDEETPVSLSTREEFRNETQQWNVSEDERTFENVTHEAMFLVGEDADAVEVQRENLGAGVGGYYSPERNEIVVVTDDEETLRFNETVLAHELVHSLQDQQFNLSRYDERTLDGSNAEDGIVEGDASYTELRYEQACQEGPWEGTCLQRPAEGEQPSADDLANLGLYLVLFQPYSDGPAFVDQLYREGGWEAVDAAYEDPPNSSEQVIYPDKYPEDDPTAINLTDRSDDDWEPVAVENRPDYEVVGEGALFSSFIFTSFHENTPGVIGGQELLNPPSEGQISPYDYSHEYTDGWEGDRLRVYENGDGETGYVWAFEWENASEAETFVEGYRGLLGYWNAESVDDRANTYTIDERFSGAYYVEQDGARVAVVHAPSVEELRGIVPDAAPEVDPEEGNGDDEQLGDGNGSGSSDGGDGDGGDGNDSTADDGDSIPGFGVGAALVAALLATALIARRDD